jgi:hypothetical protein
MTDISMTPTLNSVEYDAVGYGTNAFGSGNAPSSMHRRMSRLSSPADSVLASSEFSAIFPPWTAREGTRNNGIFNLGL